MGCDLQECVSAWLRSAPPESRTASPRWKRALRSSPRHPQRHPRRGQRHDGANSPLTQRQYPTSSVRRRCPCGSPAHGNPNGDATGGLRSHPTARCRDITASASLPRFPWNLFGSALDTGDGHPRPIRLHRPHPGPPVGCPLCLSSPGLRSGLPHRVSQSHPCRPPSRHRRAQLTDKDDASHAPEFLVPPRTGSDGAPSLPCFTRNLHRRAAFRVPTPRLGASERRLGSAQAGVLVCD